MNYSDLFSVSALANVAVGLLSSWLFFWWLNYGLKPRARVRSVTKTDVAEHSDYSFVLENTGRRAMVEPRVVVTFKTHEPGRILNVPVSNTNILNLPPAGFRKLWLQLGEMSPKAYAILGPELTTKLKAGQVGALEELLSFGGGGSLHVELIANDAVSGARKYVAITDGKITLARFAGGR